MTVSQPHPSFPSYRPFEIQPIFKLLPPGKSAAVPPFAPGTPWFPLHHMKRGFLIPKDPWPVLPPISFFCLSPCYQGPSYDHLINIWQWRKVVVPIFLLLFTVRFSFWMISAVWGWAWWFTPVILALGRNSRPALAGYTVSSKVQDECGLQEILSQNKALLFQSVGDSDTAIRYNYITDKYL